MRTAEEILSANLDKYLLSINDISHGTDVIPHILIKSINEARIEAIKECAEAAKVTDSQWQGKNDIDKQSILNLINQVK